MIKTLRFGRPQWLLLYLILLLQYVPAAAQSTRTRFTLTGTINRSAGPILLIPLGGNDNQPATTATYQTTIVNGRFTLTGEAPYPLGFLIASFPEYVSNPFIVEAGTQAIQCNADSMREIPRIDNPSMRELRESSVNFFATLSLATQRKQQLLAYVTQRPTSYVGLWATVQLLDYGYDPLLDSTYLAFAATIRKTFTGTQLGRRLAAARITAIGKPFPAVTLQTSADQFTQLPSFQPVRYTLVDFWFSRCGACIDEFPTLKTLFNLYSRSDFNVVQISIDKKPDIALWKKTIQQHELTWPQYLDESGKFTSGVLSINAFPANFLVDQQGKIIRKDIRPVDLEKFLATKLAPSPK